MPPALSSDQPSNQPPDQPPTRPDGHPWRTAGFLLLLGEALVPLGFAVWALVVIVTGRAVVVRNDLLVGLLMLITGLGLVLVATRVREGRAGVRIAALLWQALLLLAVAGPMWQVGRRLLAAVVAVWAVTTGVAIVKATAGGDPRSPAAGR